MKFYYEITKGQKYRVYDAETGQYTTVGKLNSKDKLYYIFGEFEASDAGLIQYRKQFEKWTDELKNNDIFKIDYIKEFKSHDIATLCMFKKLCHGKYEQFEDIDFTESCWMQRCDNSFLRYCEAGTYDSYGYDFKLFYPSILNSKALLIPTKRGKEYTLKKDEIDYHKLSIGYYHVNVRSEDKNFKKVFIFSKDNVYTHTSLLFAYDCMKNQNMKLTMDLVEDGEPNAYIYGKHSKDGIVNGYSIFRKWYEVLSTLRNAFPKNQLIKHLMSSVWGRISQYNKIYKTFDELELEEVSCSMHWDEEYDYVIQDILINAKGETNYKLVNINKPYKLNIARSKCFLLSRGRYITGKIALLHIDDLIRIHTDNITFKKQHDDICTKYKTFPKLVSEDKTTGLIKWKNLTTYEKVEE